MSFKQQPTPENLRKGMLVTYDPGSGPLELGVVKSWTNRVVFVSYRYAEKPEDYDNYTASATPYDKLCIGWPALPQAEFLGAYDFLSYVPNYGLCGIERQLFTVAIKHGCTLDGFLGRWCFPDYLSAKLALLEWDGSGDPPGDWIKYKGGRTEYPNPNF